MQYTLIFGSWTPTEGEGPAEDIARVWSSLQVAFRLPAAAQGQPGGANMSSTDNLSAALELVRMFRETRESEKQNRLSPSGDSYILSNAAMELLKGNWKALRGFLGAGEAEDVVLVEEFLMGVEQFDPNKKPKAVEETSEEG